MHKSLSSFDKFAHTYGEYNVIQKKIIKKYLPFLKKRIVDLGCGSEGLCKYTDFEFYLGVDKSEKMLQLNPCNTLKADFNTKECFDLIKKYDFEQIVSFSALQWARDLKFVFEEIKKLDKEFLLAIFTSNTFKSLHNFLGVKSPIYSKEEIVEYAKILQPKIEILRYEMTFDKPKSLLDYIKFSGVKGDVSAGRAKIREFMRTFPVKKLEFEVVVLK
ncbi:methyltransferase [Caminibacter pacificus]|jgi:malonyl-CoA O-methyltransferase|uniref:Methyltransferase n=1 Tax=Caminibacter pacificus TaxID=1424653 RepID=A0AAJ4UX44_9BACT|nr:methyltransferase [Caminibacter pacificus]NPA88251.1 methyltransferase [Campylobacterota bacterium]QCI27462.1 methyltransferase [Caminibacter pacificus]ROR38899.1 malonyl-CoA O-methyltransferase [Caminibacter pacificus]